MIKTTTNCSQAFLSPILKHEFFFLCTVFNKLDLLKDDSKGCFVS